MKQVGLAVLAAGVLALSAGCPVAESRTSNQGGGSIISAAAKIAQGQLSSLTPDEIQILADTVSQASPDIDVNVDDSQAEAASDFLAQNSIETFDDLESLANNPGDIVIPETLEALINSGVDVESIVIQAGREAEAAQAG